MHVLLHLLILFIRSLSSSGASTRPAPRPVAPRPPRKPVPADAVSSFAALVRGGHLATALEKFPLATLLAAKPGDRRPGLNAVLGILADACRASPSLARYSSDVAQLQQNARSLDTFDAEHAALPSRQLRDERARYEQRLVDELGQLLEELRTRLAEVRRPG